MNNDLNKYCRFWLLVALTIIVVGLIVSSQCFGQDRPPDIRITDFGGQNSKSSIFGMAPNEGRRSLNIDPSLVPPALRKRKGYVAMTDTLPGTTPVYGLWPFTFQDGVKRLFGVTDQRGPDTSLTGLGHLVVSDAFGYSLDFSGAADSLFGPIYTGVTPTFTGANGDVIISFDNRQRPLIVTQHGNNLVARNLIPPAPGEPFIVPMNDTAGWGLAPNGEYRYIIKATTQCGSGDSIIAIDDAGFETWTNDSILTNWYDTLADSAKHPFLKDSVSNIQGSYCVYYNTSSGYIVAQLRDTIVDISNNTSYTLSLSVIDSSSIMHAQLYMYIISLNDMDTLVNKITNLTYYWDRYSYDFTTNATTDSLQVEIGIRGGVPGYSVTVYLDSLLLESEPDVLYDSYLSQPVKAYNEKVLLANFLFHTKTVNCDTSDANWDDLDLSIYRSMAYPEEINELDSFYRIANYQNLTDSILDTLRIIDSIPDDSLITWPGSEIKIYDDTKRGRETDQTISGFHVGAPTYRGRNTEGDTSNVCFISLPKYKYEDTGVYIIDSTLQYMAYGMTYFDSITNTESDMGRLLYIFCNDSTGDSNFTVALPPLPAGVEHYTRILYKMDATLYPGDTSWGNIVLRYDTIEVTVNIGYTFQHEGWAFYPGYSWSSWDNADRKWVVNVNPPGDGPSNSFERLFISNDVEVPIYSLDTTESQFYPIAYIRDSSVKQFIDTTDWSLIVQQMPFASSVSPVNLGPIVWIFDRAWSFVNADVYWSYLDSGSRWSPFNNFAFRLDDGSNITKIKDYRDHIKIYKSNDQFLIYQGTGGEYSQRWVVRGIGCIASRSMADYNNGLVYLSSEGVLYETGLIYKDKGSSYKIISLPIQDIIDAWTPNELRTAVGIIHENKYIMSIPAKDTTLVYNFISQKWTIYDFSFSQAAFYDTIAGVIRPAKDFLFIKADDDRIFKGDTLGTDLGTNRAIYWKSGPLAISPMKKGIDRIGFYVEPNDIDSSFGLILYNDQDIAVDSFSITPASVYHEITIPVGLELGNFFYVEVYQPGGASTSSLADINGIDIWLHDGFKEYTD